MKKVLLAVIVAVFAISANAQVKFGVKAGVNFANMKITDESFDSRTGFHVGVISDISLLGKLAIQPGVLFSQKGTKTDGAKMNLNYIDVPVNLMYKFGVGPIKIFVAAGPNFGYGIGGKLKIDGQDDEDVKFGSGDDDTYKALDLGLNLGAGVQISSIQVGLQYTFGLSNISNADEGTIKNKVFGISVAYLF